MKKYMWIKECYIPVFGICAAHQIIGKLFGSNYLKSTGKEAADVYMTIL